MLQYILLVIHTNLQRSSEHERRFNFTSAKLLLPVQYWTTLNRKLIEIEKKPSSELSGKMNARNCFCTFGSTRYDSYFLHETVCTLIFSIDSEHGSHVSSITTSVALISL